MTKKTKIKCTKNCPVNGYDCSVRRCKFGKINPPTVKGGVEAVKWMGISYICQYANHRDAIVQKLSR